MPVASITQEGEARDHWAQEFKVSLGNMARPCLKKK
jgi:hypothetical protein